MTSMFFGACMSVCITPYVITTIMKEFNASIFQIALIPVIIQASGFLGLPMAILCNRFNPKTASIFLYSLARTFLFVFILVFLYQDSTGDKASVFLLTAYSLMGVLGASAVGLTNSWFKQVIPENTQATILGRRNALGSLVICGLTPVIGLAMTKHNLVGLDKHSLYFFMISFALVVGYIDLYFLTKVQGCPAIGKRGLSEILREVKSICMNRKIWNVSTISVIANSSALIIIPFVILLYYDLGMNEFMVGIITAISMLGVAVGSITGGYFSDRQLIKQVFVYSSALSAITQLFLLGLTIAVFSRPMHPVAICALTAAPAFLMTFAQSCVQTAHIKYTYFTVKDASSIAFAFIAFVRNLVILFILSISANLGALLARRSDILCNYLWNGWHYTQVLLLGSIVIGVLSCIYLQRANLYQENAYA